MRQSQRVQPQASASTKSSTPAPSSRDRLPQPSPSKADRDRSAPPRTMVQRILASKQKQKLENGLNVKTDTDDGGVSDEYRTVPISYSSIGSVRITPSVLPPKPQQHRVSSSTRSHSIVRSRPPSFDSELPLTQETTKNPSSGAVISTLESEQRVTPKHWLPFFASKNPSESAITVGEDFAGDCAMKDSNKARAILMSTDVRPVIVDLATSVPSEYPFLDLSEQDLHDEDLSHILRLLEVYPYAAELDLYGNKLSFSNCRGLIFGKNHQSLHKLTLSKNELGGLSSHSSLGRFLSNFPSLMVLEMADCGLTDDDLLRIGADLKGLAALKRLNLSGNRVTNAATLVLGQVLDAISGLEKVDLSFNAVTSSFVRALSRHKRKLVTRGRRKCCKDCALM